MLDHLIHLDKNLLLWLNGFHNPFFDKLMWWISDRREWIPFYVVLLALLIWKYRRASIWIILSIVVMIALSDQLANLLKNGVQRTRPCKDNEIGMMVHLVNNYCVGAFGFVSGHASNSFALATFVSLLYRKGWVTAVMTGWAVLVSYSRIYLGVHYPGDVLGGAMLGTLLAFLIYALWWRFAGERQLQQ